MPRRFVALAATLLAVLAVAPAVAQEDEDANSEARAAAKQVLARPIPPETEVGVRIQALFQRAEAFRALGDLQGQVGELRKAHVAAGGGHARVAHLLASATHLAGDWDEARRIREDQFTRDLTPVDRFTHLVGLAGYHVELAELSKAESRLEEARKLMLERPRSAWHDAMYNWARSRILVLRGKLGEAESAARQGVVAIQRYVEERGPKPDPQLLYLRNLIEAHHAITLRRLARFTDAEWVLRDTLGRSTRETGAESVQSARILVDLAENLLRQGRVRDAQGYLERAAAAISKSGLSSSAHVANRHLLLRGWAGALAGRDADAIAAFEERARGMPKTGWSGSIVWGYAQVRQGNAASALPMLEEHWRRARAQSTTSYTVRERAGMYAVALHRAGRKAEAAKVFSENMPALVEIRRRQRSVDRADVMLDTYARWIVDGYLEHLAERAEGGDAAAVETAFAMAEAVRGSAVQRALSLAATRASLPDAELAELAREEQDLGNRHGSLSRIVEELLRRPAALRPASTIAAIRSDIEGIGREREALRARIARQFPRYADLIEPRAVTMETVRGLLRPGEALLATYTSETETYAWVIRASGPPRFARVRVGSAALAQAVGKLRRALDVGSASLAAFPEFDVEGARSLYDALLKPVEAGWSGAASLIAVPHGALAQLPLALLPSRPGAMAAGSLRFEGYRRVHWLLRDVAVVQLPTVGALAALRPSGAVATGARASRPFAGFGDPSFSRASPSAAASRGLSVRNRDIVAGGDPAKPVSAADFARLPPLPDTALEIREVAAALKADPTDIALGADASETNVKSRPLVDYRVIMFATHGLVPGELDGLTQPALALSNPELTGEKDADGLLTLDEVLGLKLDAEWVVLSACNTAAADGAGSEAVSGLGRAFFFAGARSLLVSNWPVETVSARLITTDVFQRQARDTGLSRAEALRRAMLDLADRGTAKDASGRDAFAYAHPMFWAPFTLVGDGGPASPAAR